MLLIPELGWLIPKFLGLLSGGAKSKLGFSGSSSDGQKPSPSGKGGGRWSEKFMVREDCEFLN